MIKPVKKIFSKMWWLGHGTATVMGLAVLLALTVGLASTALAGTGVGARFDLGKTNLVNQASKLVGSVAGPSLTIDNNSTGTGATALRLEVEPGKPPMTVNSTVEVQGLNVDSLDSKNSSDFLQESERDDFLPNDTYEVSSGSAGSGGGTPAFRSAACDEGDKVLGGGGSGDIFRDDLLFSAPEPVGEFGGRDRWSIVVMDNADATFVDAQALCADFPPLR
ncbi:MAG TPA: hypothetical protein VGV91_03140 [Rubrobacter sp.]|nr:hypothetical protein [Rubrobacter sp.]